MTLIVLVSVLKILIGWFLISCIVVMPPALLSWWSSRGEPLKPLE